MRLHLCQPFKPVAYRLKESKEKCATVLMLVLSLKHETLRFHSTQQVSPDCDPCSLPTHSGAGTSGGELEEESWQPPDTELIQKLVTQIEFYLSDENLEHDAFLLKHVRRNKLGFVSVKLLTSFKKVTMTASLLCKNTAENHLNRQTKVD